MLSETSHVIKGEILYNFTRAANLRVVKLWEPEWGPGTRFKASGAVSGTIQKGQISVLQVEKLWK